MSVAYVLDELFFRHHAPTHHPERPERLLAIRDALHAIGLSERARQLPVRPAREDELVRVHTAAYLAELERRIPGQTGWLDEDTYYCADSWAASLAAAAAVVDLTDGVLNGDFRRGLALVRPPGHHAEADRAMGFCLLNNVAVAAAAARAGGISRVAIFDWDVHHGNGTQNIFYDDGAVLFCSLHQYPFYPGTGSAAERGTGAGQGATLNVPMEAGSGDSEYLQAWRAQVAPAIRAHRPELLLVSGGFDAFCHDPLGGMNVTSAGFGILASEVCVLADEVCDGRLVCALEGGYDLTGLGSSVAATFEAMSAEAP